MDIFVFRENWRREGYTSLMGVNEATVTRVLWDRMAFWVVKPMYHVAEYTICHLVYVKSRGTISNHRAVNGQTEVARQSKEAPLIRFAT